MEVQSMSRHRLDIRLKAARIGEVHLDTRRYTGRSAASSKAVTATVRQVVLARDHEHGTLVRVHHGQRAEGEEFTLGNGLLGGFCPVEDSGVEGAGEEEQVLLRVGVGVDDVAVGVVECLAYCAVEVKTGNVVGERVLLGEVVETRSDRASGGGAAEAEGLVEVGKLEVGASGEVADEGGVHAEAGEDDTITQVGVGGDESVGLGGAERVANVDDLGVGLVDVGHAAVADHHSEGA